MSFSQPAAGILYDGVQRTEKCILRVAEKTGLLQVMQESVLQFTITDNIVILESSANRIGGGRVRYPKYFVGPRCRMRGLRFFSQMIYPGRADRKKGRLRRTWISGITRYANPRSIREEEIRITRA